MGGMGGMSEGPQVVGSKPDASGTANSAREMEQRRRRSWHLKIFISRWWLTISMGILALIFLIILWGLLPKKESFMAPDVEKEEVLPKYESKATGPRPGQPGHPVGMFGFPSKRSFFFGLP